MSTNDSQILTTSADRPSAPAQAGTAASEALRRYQELHRQIIRLQNETFHWLFELGPRVARNASAAAHGYMATSYPAAALRSDIEKALGLHEQIVALYTEANRLASLCGEVCVDLENDLLTVRKRELPPV